jgi:molecular chaperone HtpG
MGADDEARISKLCLFRSSHGDEPTTLPEYVARMPEGQEEIYYITGDDAGTLAASPHLEQFRRRGYEVLFLTDAIDEWMIDRLTSFEGHDLRSVHGADVELATDEEKAHVEAEQKAAEKLLRALASHYGDAVSDVRFTARLVDSPGVLVTEKGALRPHMARFLKETQKVDKQDKRILELNPDHPLIERLRAMHKADPDDQRLWDYADLLHGQVLLSEGSALPDPARFSKLVGELMVSAE